MKEDDVMLELHITLYRNGGMSTQSAASNEVPDELRAHLAIGCLQRSMHVALSKFEIKPKKD